MGTVGIAGATVAQKKDFRGKYALVALSRVLFNGLYRLFCLGTRRDEVLFFSRQANHPSEDFVALGREFMERGWQVCYLTKKLSKRSVPSYCPFIVRELYHLARCRICFVDRYDPVICLLDFKGVRESGLAAGTFDEFPTEPLIIQLWHAFGAFKKFGYQSVDTPEGHDSANAELFRIHRNYSYVICSGEGAQEAFAEAFRVPRHRVVPLLRPEYDRLVAIGRRRSRAVPAGGQGGRLRILFAPTLRSASGSPRPFVDLYRGGAWRVLEEAAQVAWSFHPLERQGEAAGDINELLPRADMVVTDYSSIVYEAAILRIPVLFYVPDIGEYRLSPGLNADPAAAVPSIAFQDADALIDALLRYDPRRKESYLAPLDRFCRQSGLAVPDPGGPSRQGETGSSAASVLVDFALSALQASSEVAE